MTESTKKDRQDLDVGEYRHFGAGVRVRRWLSGAAALFVWLAFVVTPAAANCWESLGPAGTNLTALAIDPGNSNTLYAASWGGGLFVTGNAGQSWTANNFNLTNLYLSSVVSGGTQTWVGTAGGVFLSQDGGSNWVPTNVGLTDLDVYTLSLDATFAPATLYAGTDFGGGVFKSQNNGLIWSPINSGITSTQIRSFAIDPTNRSVLYAGTLDAGVSRSINGGSTWAASGLDALYIAAIAIDPTNTSTLYAGDHFGGVNKSTTSGSFWDAINVGLTDPFIASLAVDPTNPNRVFAGTQSGLFMTTDGGDTWTSVKWNLPDAEVSDILFGPGGVVYVATYGGDGVYRSSNPATPCHLFADGFESGDTSLWSSSVP